jgi:hypothetical protein
MDDILTYLSLLISVDVNVNSARLKIIICVTWFKVRNCITCRFLQSVNLSLTSVLELGSQTIPVKGDVSAGSCDVFTAVKLQIMSSGVTTPCSLDNLQGCYAVWLL